MRKGSPLIYPVTVRVRIGEPVETAGLTLDDRDTLIASVRESVARVDLVASSDLAGSPARATRRDARSRTLRHPFVIHRNMWTS